jgi:integrase
LEGAIRRALRRTPQRSPRAPLGDLDVEAKTLRIEESVVAVAKGTAWSDAKNARSRRRIPLDDDTMRALKRRRVDQATERLLAGAAWEDHDLIIATRSGKLVLPRSYDRALALSIEKAKVPRLTSHGLRHTAATHMVAAATDVGQLRAIADILGHSPDMLMKTYAHAMPASTSAVVTGIAKRGG